MALLYLMRHAQAESAGAGERDHDRPLDGEGQLAAKQLGRALRERGVAPDLVLCSTARRVTETWDAVASEWRVAPEMVADDGLYLAPPQALLSRLSELPSKVRAPLLIGHNPGLFELALSMASDGTPEANVAKLVLETVVATGCSLRPALSRRSAERDEGEAASGNWPRRHGGRDRLLRNNGPGAALRRNRPLGGRRLDRRR